MNRNPNSDATLYVLLVELCADDEVVDGHLRLVPVPVLQLYQQLLRFRESNVVPVQKSNPVVL